MAWYDTGTVSVTNGSPTVTGSGTNFLSGAQVGEAFYGPDGRLYDIQAIVSATVITLANNYVGATNSSQTYKIIPTQSLVATLTSQVSNLITDFQDVKDEAGAGKFSNGTIASPAIVPLLDQDTGLSFPAANQVATSTGGTQRTLLSSAAYQVDVPITGTAIQSSATDVTVGRLARADYAYSKGNLLGTVSQSGGVPTGAVIERGSNTNGEYIRWANGTQICIRRLIVASTGNPSWTFPVVFSAVPVLSIVSESSDPRFCVMPNPTVSSVDLFAFDEAGVRRGVSAGVTAIGRWF